VLVLCALLAGPWGLLACEDDDNCGGMVGDDELRNAGDRDDAGADAGGRPEAGTLEVEARWDAAPCADPNADSDGDGVGDCAVRVLRHCEPGATDTDGDGLTECAEWLRHTSATAPDSDGNGLPDGQAVIGERITLTGPFVEPFPELRLGDATLSGACTSGGACEVRVPAALEAGRQPLRVAGQTWFELDVVRLALVAAAGAELRRLDAGDGGALGHPLALPARPGAVAVLPDGARAVATSPRADALAVVDVPAWRTTTLVTLEGLPSSVSVDAAGTTAAVELVLGQRVALVALAAPEAEPTWLGLADVPGGVVLSPSGEWLAVTLPALGEVLVVPITDGRPGTPVSVALGEGSSPGQVAWDPSAEAFLVVLGGAGELARVAPPAGPPVTIGLQAPAPVTLAVAPDGRSALVGTLDGRLVGVHLGADPGADAALPLDTVPGVAVFLSGTHAWVPESYGVQDPALPGSTLALVSFDGGTLEITGRIEAPDGPWMVALQP